MKLSQKGVGSAMLATASGRIDLSNADDSWVAPVQPMLAEIFTITRLSQVIPIFQTTREAIAKLAPDGLAEFDAG
jgi:hypothetical protein